jgi:cardiolipin synthase (CMP-forming)
LALGNQCAAEFTEASPRTVGLQNFDKVLRDSGGLALAGREVPSRQSIQAADAIFRSGAMLSYYRSLPNLITLGRFVLAPAIVAMIATQRWKEACIVFIIAGLSDAVDGWLANTYDLRSELGAYLDPLADKALIVSIYVSLAVVEVLPATIVILVVARDIMIIGAFMISLIVRKPIKVKPLTISKLNTAAQIGFAAMVLSVKAFDFPAGAWFNVALYAVAALTLASTAAYFGQWIKYMNL